MDLMKKALECLGELRKNGESPKFKVLEGEFYTLQNGLRADLFRRDRSALVEDFRGLEDKILPEKKYRNPQGTVSLEGWIILEDLQD